MFSLKYLGSADPYLFFFVVVVFFFLWKPFSHEIWSCGESIPYGGIRLSPVLATSAHGSLPKLSLCATESRVPMSNH